MMKNISVGIDVGTSTTRVVAGEYMRGKRSQENPKIIGTGEAPTLGLRHGYVVDQALAANSVKNALRIAEKSAGIEIKRAYISLGGVSLRGETSTGIAIISKANGEVTNLDINNALEDSEENLNLSNKKVVQVFPLSYRLDGKEVHGRLEGMRGTKLEVKALFVTYSVQHLEDLISTVAQAGVETIDVIASPLALAEITLNQKQKIVGVALVDIGSETTSLSIFENGLPMSIHTFSIGGADITNDIALGLRISLEASESAKLGIVSEEYSEKKLRDIIEARLSDIFELIENHLKKIKRAELLPAGIIFVGGGAGIRGLPELSKDVLKLPSAIGTTEIFGNAKTKLRDPAWLTALSLVLVDKESGGYHQSSFGSLFKDLKRTIKASVKQLMP